MGTRGLVGYKHNGEIKGWYNHFDSYPSGLGEDIVSMFHKYSDHAIREFFLKRVALRQDDTDDNLYSNHKTVLDLDWNKDSVELQDGSEFIKDGLYCEYGYVFDLDSKKVRLMLFEGFGKKPSKGYEDFFYQLNSKSDKHYENFRGYLSRNKDILVMRIKLYLKYKDEEVSKIHKAYKKNLGDLPTMIGDLEEDFSKEYITYLLKTGAKETVNG